MYKNLFLAVFAFAVLNCAEAFACDDQVGKVIFEDNFSDDSGGWDTYDDNKATSTATPSSGLSAEADLDLPRR